MNNLYMRYLKSEQKSDKTIESYVRCITKTLDYIGKPDDKITYLDLIDWKASLSGMASATICLYISAIESYFEFLHNAGLVEENPAKKLTRPQIKNKEKPYMTAADLRALVNNARTLRDKAIFLLYGSTGLRVSELTNITLEDYAKAKANNGHLVVLGKGNKERTTYINEETMNAIEAYLPQRSSRARCDKLFLSFQGNEIARGNLGQTIKTAAKNAGLPYWNELSNHSLRAGCATVYAQAGVNVSTIQHILGHSSLSVTTRYIKNTQANIDNAIMVGSF